MSRTNREKAIDLGLVALTAVLCVPVAGMQDRGLSLYPQLTSGAGPFGMLGNVLPWPVGVVDVGEFPALLACALLWWRRRWPVLVAVMALVASTLSPAAIPVIVSLFTVAVCKPARTALWVMAGALAPVPATLVLNHYAGLSGVSSALFGCTFVVAAMGWGFLVSSLHERTDRAEAEAVLRAERAQQGAREEIAREMHDVLAHRLSLLSVHAGALEFNPGASSAEIGQAAGVIRQSAHQALQDLQLVLRVLRAPLRSTTSEPSHPTLRDVRRLVDESSAAGMWIELDQDIDAPARVPSLVGRTVYRIVQEGLTNARKHAPGEPVHITVRGKQGEGLTVDMRNPVPSKGVPGAGIPGSGQGLIGLSERAALAGGHLDHGRAGDDHHLHAWIPWPV
ncbi:MULTISPECIES: sensor histidine kinase [unclassified Streptomyces]|uniref:sensor histidine kinase n=1 Tax=unclassified Streptomyces TaxID=2593676 RepID=UPI00217DF3F5|nr:histidine kinase [Streptomyces sp. ZS0098]